MKTKTQSEIISDKGKFEDYLDRAEVFSNLQHNVNLLVKNSEKTELTKE